MTADDVTSTTGVPSAGETTGIVVGVDSSESSAHALDWALDEAARRDLPVHVVYAWTSPPNVLPGRYGAVVHGTASRDELQRQPQTFAEELVAKAQAGRDGPIVAVSVSAREGRPAAVLIEAALGADQLVVGSRGAGGFSRLALGSVSDQVVRHGRVPVTVVRSDTAHDSAGRPRVVVGVDGSPASRAALRRAAETARARGATLDIVQAYDRGVSYVGTTVHLLTADEARAAAMRALNATADDVLGDTPVDDLVVTHRRVDEGDPADVLLGIAEGAALLVLGSRGREGFRGLLLGSVSMKCLHHAGCTLQIVPPSVD